MQSFELLNRRERCCGGIVASMASASLLSAALLVFAGDGRTPWFAEDSGLALAARQCEQFTASTARHQCLRQIALDASSRALPFVAMAGR